MYRAYMSHVGRLAAAALLVFLTVAASAQDSPETPLLDAPPAPSPAVQAQVIEEVRVAALQYTANLPNFICTQTLRRFGRQKSSQPWKPEDTMTLDLAYSEEGERYNLRTINGKPTKQIFEKVDGFTSSGDFGTTLQWIFRPKSETKFRWERWTRLRGQVTQVFSYRIEQDHSDYTLNFDTRSEHHRAVVAFSGLIYVDRETKQVLRLTHAPESIPADFPIRALSSDLDYGFADVGGQIFLLPLHAEMRLVMRNGAESRNSIEFSNYHKFSSEATITFGKP